MRSQSSSHLPAAESVALRTRYPCNKSPALIASWEQAEGGEAGLELKEKKKKKHSKSWITTENYLNVLCQYRIQQESIFEAALSYKFSPEPSVRSLIHTKRNFARVR